MYKILFSICVLSIILVGCSDKYKTKEDILQQGMGLLASGNPGGAIVMLKNALERDQNYFDARLALARAYLAAGKSESAEKELRKLEKQLPNSREVHVEMARVHVRKSSPDEALSEIGDSVTSDCMEPNSLKTVGRAHALKGNFNTSLGLLKRSMTAENSPPFAVAIEQDRKAVSVRDFPEARTGEKLIAQ